MRYVFQSEFPYCQKTTMVQVFRKITNVISLKDGFSILIHQNVHESLFYKIQFVSIHFLSFNMSYGTIFQSKIPCCQKNPMVQIFRKITSVMTLTNGFSILIHQNVRESLFYKIQFGSRHFFSFKMSYGSFFSRKSLIVRKCQRSSILEK